jgi:hypothetical protein
MAEQAGGAQTALVETGEPQSENRGEDPAQGAARCSPDPMQHTDRYRLVTPFSLRL